MSDSECALRRGMMANSDEQPSEPSRDHEGNLNSPSHFFIDFANKAMACAPTVRTIADDIHELPAYAKRKVLKGLVDDIMENLLKGLPEVEKEFLDDCFKALYEKLPWKSQVSVANQVLGKLLSLSLSSSPSSSPSPSPWGSPWLLEPLQLLKPCPPWPGMFFVSIPDTIGSGNVEGHGRPAHERLQLSMPVPEEPLPPEMFSMGIPDTIGSGNVDGRGRQAHEMLQPLMPVPEEPLPPEMFSMDILDTIGSGRGRGRGQEGVKK